MTKIVVLMLTGWLCWISPALASPAQSAAAPHPDVSEALDHLRSQEYRKAAKVCKKAKGLEGEDLAMCSLVLAISCNQTGDPAGAIDAALRVIEMVEDRLARQRAFTELGVAHATIVRGRSQMWPRVDPGPKTREHLANSEQALRSALALEGSDLRAQFQLANVLIARMLFEEDWSRYDEVQEILSDYLDEEGLEGRHREWAERMLCRHFEFDFEPVTEEPLFIGPVVDEDTGGEAIVSKPIKLSTQAPQYNDLARMARIQGVVILQAVINTEGRIQQIVPLKGLPLCLTEEAMKAVAGWTFEPATLNGEPVPVFYNLTVNFRLGN